MNNKFLALAAFGTAALGSAIVSAPANAAIPPGSGPSGSITLNLTVPEVLYLRTITDFTLDPITAGELTSNTLTPVAGTTPPALVGENGLTAEEAGGTVNTASPFNGDFLTQTVQRTIPSAYIVWSNSPTGQYSVNFTPNPLTGPNGATVDVAVEGGNTAVNQANGLLDGGEEDIVLNLNATNGNNIRAGDYTGTIGIAVYRP